MAHKVMIDADAGVSDALAIALALADPDLDVLAVTAVGGRVSVQQAARNLITLLEAVDPAKWPRIGVADAPDADYDLARFTELMADELPVSRQLHGPYGFGDWPVGDAELHHPRSAAKLLQGQRQKARVPHLPLDIQRVLGIGARLHGIPLQDGLVG